MSSRRANSLTIALIGILSLACSANTQYAGVPTVQLSDEQLVEELQSAVQGYGIAVDRSSYLLAIRPGPAYVLTSSSTAFAGSINATYNAYTMPVGYGLATSGTVVGQLQGTAYTQYRYTDVNAGARLGNMIAVSIQRSRQAAYRRRAQEVWLEYQDRVARRRAATEQMIQTFFSVHPELNDRRMLVAAMAPWVAAEGSSDGRETLERTSQRIAATPRGNGLNGLWYGVLSQTTTLQDGQTLALSEFVRITLTESNGNITGTGALGSGEKLELTGTLRGSHLDASIANTTSAINVTASALTAPSQITGEYDGFGQGARLHGQFTLLR